ncbi:archaeal proteasome endopeptidase complex subunit alpha [Candidatus Bathyarchaeota archaeon]|jgi:proteasome alpha subunit|nr:archaeal proteasome endopeptidase complex subunit alpha [Candidatus Bathyarchaeota archaeon]MBT4320551.1 archaeal proteasome endopeptidase complex subunit alpha [Candidatus Bathyarchaeota archaeon]MBT4423501.1 archaeal proteasome endopeptidase complex subunit alpha [Candidatus Bathyarchaeota archaeon]MBT6604760.1 archaeal proteasome endopeptidase complex subunit alpha [Candidatus Bathyarchaeota archaeon]MBT7188424.1 archaeal proteasome endopeptidase complex subunit alpha [Candidatus Bathyarc
MSRGREYDGAITIFSPEGRIYQVEYALELVKRGSPIVGIKSDEGVVLAVLEPQLSKLAAPTSSKKIFRIDDHVGVAIAGLSPDARVLIKQSRLFCQSNKMTYDEPADIEDLASAVGDLLQRYTQNAGVRPFGVSLLFGGVDDHRVSLIATDPSGSYRGYRATSVGRNSDKALAVLKEEYRLEITLDEAIALSAQALKEASDNDLSADGVNIAVVTKETKKFRSLSVEEIQKYL